MFENRELSWLKFNARVLALSTDERHPLCEQLNFLAISASNLDEFFMVRIGSVCDHIIAGDTRVNQAGYTPAETLNAALEAAREQMISQYNTLQAHFVPRLKEKGIRLLSKEELTPALREKAEAYFRKNLQPELTVLPIDLSHGYPLLHNKSLNLAVRLFTAEGKRAFATIALPENTPRLVEMEKGCYMFAEEIIKLHLPELFPGKRVDGSQMYRITRNADLAFSEDAAGDLLTEIEQKLAERKWGAVIRLELQAGGDPMLVTLLTDALDVDERMVYTHNGPLGLAFVRQAAKALPDPALRYTPFTPRELVPKKADMFEVLREGDLFLHHPYDAFTPVTRLLEQAAEDENVIAIKQTLYRVSEKSPIVQALLKAAQAGKQVTVLFEVKARFDEENNIHWGRLLEQAGCHVIYGLPGLKTHSKITLVLRREGRSIRPYLHLGTGNYNDVTARLYTDMALMTADRQLGIDATLFFNMLSGYAAAQELSELCAAPEELAPRLLTLIEKQTRRAQRGEEAEIIAKMNSLVDTEVISALYRASAAGVRIRLVVRGICCLKAGVPGLSENIQVRSIVGRFLEHSRIFCFLSEKEQEVYLSSADWMPRNLYDRVELMFPVKDARIADHILSIMRLYLSDTANAWQLNAAGEFERVLRAEDTHPIDVQQSLIDEACGVHKMGGLA